MLTSELHALAREAWAEHDPMLALCDYMEENNLISLSNLESLHCSFRKAQALFLKEQAARNWIVKTLGIKADVEYYPVPRLANVPGNTEHMFHAFIVDNIYGEEILLDVGLQNPAPFTLKYGGPIQDKGFDHLRKVFAKIKYGKTNMDDLTILLNRHLDPNYELIPRIPELEED
jgi:hypothetical protein